MRRSVQGFTLVELLIASAIALLILLVLGQTTVSVLKISARENQNIPVQQQLRASVEVISQEIRSSIGPRVMYSGLNGAGVSLPSAVPVSSSTSVTLLIPVPNSTFIVLPPTGYPTATSLAARTATPIQNPSLTDATSTSIDCAAAFAGGSYAVLYGTQQTNYLSGAARNPDAFRFIQTPTAAACVGTGSSVALNHPQTPLPSLVWNPNTYIVEVTPVTYSVTNDVLYRQVAGQTAQVVAYNIRDLNLSYLPDNPGPGLTNCTAATFQPVPGCAPRQISVTLTSTPQRTGVAGVTNLTANQQVFLR